MYSFSHHVIVFFFQLCAGHLPHRHFLEEKKVINVYQHIYLVTERDCGHKENLIIVL